MRKLEHYLKMKYKIGDISKMKQPIYIEQEEYESMEKEIKTLKKDKERLLMQWGSDQNKLIGKAIQKEHKAKDGYRILLEYCDNLRKSNDLWRYPQDEVLSRIEDKIEEVRNC